jgi:hypothetical protein
MAIYEKLKTLTDSVVSVKSALKAKGASIDGASLSYLADKTSRLPVWDSFKSPLAQLGYTSEDEAVYKDLKIDMTTVKEDVEYSLGLVGSINKANEYIYIFKGDSNIKYVPYADLKYKSTQGMFQDCKNINTIPSFDYSEVTSTLLMFSGCSSIEYIGDLNVKKATHLYNMFSSCSSLKSIKSIDFSSAININNFITSCVSLESIPDVDTSNIITMSLFARGCQSLKSVGVIDVINAENISSMFGYCPALKELNLKNLGTKKSITIDSLTFPENWGVGSDEARQSLIDSLITYSFDRAAAGYDALTITLSTATKNVLTDEEKAAITAKGFTVV